MQPAEHFLSSHTQGIRPWLVPAAMFCNCRSHKNFRYPGALELQGLHPLGSSPVRPSCSKFHFPINAGAVNFQPTDRNTKPDSTSNDYSVPKGTGRKDTTQIAPSNHSCLLVILSGRETRLNRNPRRSINSWVEPWLARLSGLSASLQTKGSPVWFPVRAHAWVVVPGPSWWCTGGNQSMYLSHIDVSLPFFLPPFPTL